MLKQLIDQIGEPLDHSPRLEDLGWAWYRNYGENKAGETVEMWHHYPFPDIQTFRQLDRFFDVWNYHLTKYDIHTLGRSEQIELWIRAGWISTSSDGRYDIKLLSDAGAALEEQVQIENTNDLEKGMVSLQAFRHNLLVKHPLFEQFANAGEN